MCCVMLCLQHFNHWPDYNILIIGSILITDSTLQHFDHWLSSTTFWSLIKLNNILITEPTLQHFWSLTQLYKTQTSFWSLTQLYNILITDSTLQNYHILITDSILQHFGHWSKSTTFWSLMQLYSALITKLWHITVWDHQWHHKTGYDKSLSRGWKYYAYSTHKIYAHSTHKISNYRCGKYMCDLATEEPKAKEHFSRQKICLSLFKYPFCASWTSALQ